MTTNQQAVVKAVRSLMKNTYERNQVFTNKYGDVRTVKCYKGQIDLKKFTEDVNEIVTEIGAKDVTIKTHLFKMWGKQITSLIVRVPADC
jgi:Uri superfamily endonuclease